MIYLSSSWKNRTRVRAMADALRALGHEVYDFTDPRCRTTPEIPPERFPEPYSPDLHAYPAYLNRPEWRDAVLENRSALDRCNLVILLLPCGNDAHADWAYAVGRGVDSIVCGSPRPGERSPVHLWANKIVQTDHEAVQVAHTMRPGTGKVMTDRCPRIGGCLLEIGLDHCCCQDGTCDLARGYVVVRMELQDQDDLTQ